MQAWKQKAKTATSSLMLLSLILMSGCATSKNHVIHYPPSDDFFITMGDDPGSESIRPYSPKGTLIHVSTEAYLPLPLFGLATIGNANPQFVFEQKVLPMVRSMGGDAMSSARVDHRPPPNPFWRLLGFPLLFIEPSQTIVSGQVDQR